MENMEPIKNKVETETSVTAAADSQEPKEVDGFAFGWNTFRQQTGSGSLICDVCENTFTNNFDFGIHRATHVKDASKTASQETELQCRQGLKDRSEKFSEPVANQRDRNSHHGWLYGLMSASHPIKKAFATSRASALRKESLRTSRSDHIKKQAFTNYEHTPSVPVAVADSDIFERETDVVGDANPSGGPRLQNKKLQKFSNCPIPKCNGCGKLFREQEHLIRHLLEVNEQQGIEKGIGKHQHPASMLNQDQNQTEANENGSSGGMNLNVAKFRHMSIKSEVIGEQQMDTENQNNQESVGEVNSTNNPTLRLPNHMNNPFYVYLYLMDKK